MPHLARHAISLAAGLVAIGLSSQAGAQSAPEGFSVQPFDPSAASDRFFSASGATAPGHLLVSARADMMVAYKRVLGVRYASGHSEDIVSNQILIYPGATFSIDERYLFGLAAPFALSQNGDAASSPSGMAFGDMELMARFALVNLDEAFRVAPEFDLSMPTGSQDSLSGDGTFGGQVRALMDGELGMFIYAVNLGYWLRDPKKAITAEVGPAATFGAAAGVQLCEKHLQLAGELQGNSLLSGADGFFDDRTTPVYALAGVKFRWSDLVAGAAAGPSLTGALGASPRALLSLGYVPRP